jgi:hypothetical protein
VVGERGPKLAEVGANRRQRDLDALPEGGLSVVGMDAGSTDRPLGERPDGTGERGTAGRELLQQVAEPRRTVRPCLDQSVLAVEVQVRLLLGGDGFDPKPVA